MFNKDSAKVRFPWVAFLSQPIAHPTATLIVNLSRFKKLYHIWLLENCFRHELTERRFTNK
jgi:hypothetical protein